MIKNKNTFDVSKVLGSLQDTYDGKANQLSPSWHKWDILDKIEIATKEKITNIENIETTPIRRNATKESKTIVMSRRSAQMMDKNNSKISFLEFENILRSVCISLNDKPCAINLVLLVHNVENLESGIYILIRNNQHKSQLQKLMKDSFIWKKVGKTKLDLYLLEAGDMRGVSKQISCSQDIASDGAFSLGMLAEFTAQLENYGAHRYKELYWECGAIGQQLYLEATSLDLSATGIGCFLDDIFHQLLELKTNEYQSLYHFTIGRAIIDNRLSSIEPYS